MLFEKPLVEGVLLKRYKRFLADISLDDDKLMTIYCPNTGAMKTCDLCGSRIWFSESDNPRRKYKYTWELVEVDGGALVGINTGIANQLVAEGIEQGVIKELQGYGDIKSEVNYGNENSRIDFLLSGGSNDCYVEVKNVTLGDEQGVACFPDTITERGQKHLRELMAMKRAGHRAVMVYCVQHTGASVFRPADHIDAEYGRLLREAANTGVELMAYKADLSVTGIQLRYPIPIEL